LAGCGAFRGGLKVGQGAIELSIGFYGIFKDGFCGFASEFARKGLIVASVERFENIGCFGIAENI